MQKVERAIQALLETAEALDELPTTFRRKALLFNTPYVESRTLRSEAAWLRDLSDAVEAAAREAQDATPK